MKIAIVGAGFTGLSAALSLLAKDHTVTIFEKEGVPGGLASTFRASQWQWEVEKHYHHWFTNDVAALSLIKSLHLDNDLLFPKTVTAIYTQGKSFPFNTPLDVLRFTPLSFFDRIRTGIVVLFLKLLPQSLAIHLEKTPAVTWLSTWFGQRAYRTLWEPLLRGKFGPFADVVNMAWFWARIKKRTPVLGYLAGGYGKLLTAMTNAIKQKGGIVHFNTPFDPKRHAGFDRIIVTAPSGVFLALYPSLPASYKKQLQEIPHLFALNLLLITHEKLLPHVYWLNINDRSFPFIAIVQQTNMINAKHYAGHHLAYIGNYLPADHPYLNMSKEQLFKTYLPFLKKINPRLNAQFSILHSELFMAPFAQPVFGTNYSKRKPSFKTPIPNVFLANMDMVYPWDRGTNYAIELGQQVAEHAILT